MKNPDNTAWRIVRAAASLARGGAPLINGTRYALAGEVLVPVDLTSAENSAESALLMFDNGWQSLLTAADERVDFLAAYLPLAGARAEAPLVTGQLGQSLDGFIATANGDSRYVTGEASIGHLHRLRALSDCVIVGAGTVAADDPRLTTRLVSGPNPLRVVIDPSLRLAHTHHVFCDQSAPTLRVRARGIPLPSQLMTPAVEDIEVAVNDGRIDLTALLAELFSRGHRAILVEGGGFTVSAFLAAGLLDRLHVVVAPFIIGEGRPGVRMPSVTSLSDCRRPASRIYALGNDVLFDCDLRDDARAGDASSAIRRLIPAMP